MKVVKKRQVGRQQVGLGFGKTCGLDETYDLCSFLPFFFSYDGGFLVSFWSAGFGCTGFKVSWNALISVSDSKLKHEIKSWRDFSLGDTFVCGKKETILISTMNDETLLILSLREKSLQKCGAS